MGGQGSGRRRKHDASLSPDEKADQPEEKSDQPDEKAEKIQKIMSPDTLPSKMPETSEIISLQTHDVLEESKDTKVCEVKNQEQVRPSTEPPKRCWAPEKVLARSWVATILNATQSQEQVFKFLRRTFQKLVGLSVQEEITSEGKRFVHAGFKCEYRAGIATIRSKLSKLKVSEPMLIDAASYAVTGKWRVLSEIKPRAFREIVGFNRRGPDAKIWHFPDLTDLKLRPQQLTTEEELNSPETLPAASPEKQPSKLKIKAAFTLTKQSENIKRELSIEMKETAGTKTQAGIKASKKVQTESKASSDMKHSRQECSTSVGLLKKQHLLQDNASSLPTAVVCSVEKPAMFSRNSFFFKPNSLDKIFSRDWFVVFSGTKMSKDELFNAIQKEYRFLWYVAISEGKVTNQKTKKRPVYLRVQLGVSVQKENLASRLTKLVSKGEGEPVLSQTCDAPEANKRLYIDDPAPLIHGRPYSCMSPDVQNFELSTNITATLGHTSVQEKSALACPSR